jgi:hypothetical protein
MTPPVVQDKQDKEATAVRALDNFRTWANLLPVHLRTSFEYDLLFLLSLWRRS